MGTMERIQNMAEAVKDSLDRLPWDELEARYGLTPEQDATMDGHVRHYLWDALWPAYNEATQAWSDLKLLWNLEGGITEREVQADYVMENTLDNSFSVFMPAVNANHQWLPSATKFDVEVFRSFISQACFSIVRVMGMHQNGFHTAMGMSPEQIVASASQLYTACRTLTALKHSGYLDPLKKNPAPGPEQGTSGMGAIQLPIAITIGVTVFLGFCAYLYWSYKKMQLQTKWRDETCASAVEAIRTAPDTPGAAAMVDLCVQLNKDTNAALKDADPLGSAVSSFTKIIAIGLVAYGAILLAPHLMDAVMGAKKKYKAAKAEESWT